MQNGKGDKPRPVDWKKYNANFDQINWSKSSNLFVKKSIKKATKKASN